MTFSNPFIYDVSSLVEFPRLFFSQQFFSTRFIHVLLLHVRTIKTTTSIANKRHTSLSWNRVSLQSASTAFTALTWFERLQVKQVEKGEREKDVYRSRIKLFLITLELSNDSFVSTTLLFKGSNLGNWCLFTAQTFLNSHCDKKRFFRIYIFSLVLFLLTEKKPRKKTGNYVMSSS